MKPIVFARVAATNWLPAIMLFGVMLPVCLYEPLDNPAHHGGWALFQASLVTAAFCVVTLLLDTLFLLLRSSAFLLPLALETSIISVFPLPGAYRQYLLLAQTERQLDAWITVASVALALVAYLLAQWLRAKRIKHVIGYPSPTSR